MDVRMNDQCEQYEGDPDHLISYGWLQDTRVPRATEQEEPV